MNLNDNLYGGNRRHSIRIDRALDENSSGVYAIPQNQRKHRADELYKQGGFEVSVATGNVGQPTYRVGLAFDLPGGRAGVSLSPDEAIKVAHSLIIAAEQQRDFISEARRVAEAKAAAAAEEVERLTKEQADLKEQDYREKHSTGEKAGTQQALQNNHFNLLAAKQDLKYAQAELNRLP